MHIVRSISTNNVSSRCLEHARQVIPPKELEQFLDLLYGMYSNVYTLTELHQVIISDPFDRSETPRQIKLMDLTD